MRKQITKSIEFKTYSNAGRAIEKEVEERNSKFINLVSDFAINNRMTLQDIYECVDEVANVYYSDAIIERGEAER